MTTECRVCRAPSDSFGAATVLGKYRVEYFRCRDCQFMQTETPYWLEEAYQDAIISTDVGLIGRNEKDARIVSRVLRYLYPEAERCVDYGGGYGMFTRMMRDRGHDFAHYDPFCDNLFAEGLETDLKLERFDLVTAFEVLEHLDDPHRDLSTLDAAADHWLVSTMIVPSPPPPLGQWWYYALEGGQHVALWSERALQVVAAQYRRYPVTTRSGLHLFSKRPVNRRWAQWLMCGKFVGVLDRWRRRRSLLPQDYRRVLKATVANQQREAA